MHVDYSNYGKCSKILNISCLPKEQRQTAQINLVIDQTEQYDQGLHCLLDKHFVSSSTENWHFIWEQKEKSVRNFWTFTVLYLTRISSTHHKRFDTWYKKTKSSSLLDECRPDGVLLSLLHQHILVVHVLHRVLEPTLDVRFTCKRSVFINRPLACRPSVQIPVHAEQRNFMHQNVPVIDHFLYYSKYIYYITLVNVYVALPVFTRIAGTS